MNITRGLLACSFLTVTVVGYCQNPGLKWVGVYGGDNTKSATSIATDNAGNVYTAGLFYGNFDVDPTDDEHFVTSQDQGDGFVVKQNSDGEFQWVVQIPGDGSQSAYTVDVDKENNIIVSGYFEETVDFDPGSGTTEYTVTSPTPFLMKLSPSGNLLWVKVFICPDGTSFIDAVALDASNNIFLGGQFSGTADLDPSAGTFNLVSAGGIDASFSKFDKNGNFISAVRIGGTGEDFVSNVVVDHNNDLIAGGSFAGTVDLDPGTSSTIVTSNGSDDVSIIKLNNALAFVWGKQISATSQFYLGDMATDASNNLIFNGTFYGNADFDPGAGTFFLDGVNGDFFIASFTSAGNLNWAKKAGSLGQETGDVLALDASGNIFVAGRYDSQFDIDPDLPINNEIIQFEEPGYDMYIAKFSNAGLLLWYQPIPTTDIISAEDLHIDANNNVYIVGDWNEAADFSINTCVDGKRVTHDNALLYLLKITPSSDIACFGFLEQPITNQSGCAMQVLNFAAPAGGTAHIKYQWQMFISGSWADLDDREFDDGDDNYNGYYGTHTAYLQITPVEGGDNGDVRVMVTGDGVAAIYSNVAQFVVQPVPHIPGLTATSGCGPGYYAITATGTTYGKYQWYIDEVLQENDSTETVSYFFDSNIDVEVAIEENGCAGPWSHVMINTDACSQPPGLEWAQQLGPGFIKPVAMAIDNNNHVYITGQFSGTVDFNLGVGVFEMTPNGADDYFVAKYQPDGAFMWARQTDMTIYDIATGSLDDDVYYVGNFKGTVDFDPGAGTSNMSVTGTGSDMAIVELDGNGLFQWAKQLVGTSGEGGNIIRAVTDGSSGEIIVTGNFTRTVDFDPGTGTVSLTSASSGGPDIFVAKYDEDGNLLWADRIGSTAFVERGVDVETDEDGYIYAVGLFQTTVDFNPAAGAGNVFNLTSAGATDAFVMSLNSDGSFRWADRIGGTGADEAVGISLDHADHPVVVGTFTNTVDFDPGAGTFNISSGPSFILKLTDLGTFQWAKSMGGELTKVFVDPTDKVTLAGFFENNIDVDPGPDEYHLQTSVTADIYVSQLSDVGDFLWAYNTNASGLGYFTNEPVGLAMDATGSLYVLGQFSNVVDVDPTNCVYPLSTTGSGSSEAFFQKIKPNLATVCFSLQPKDVTGCENQQIHLLTEAVGTTNIAYQWQKLNTTFGYFENINPAPGYSGLNTPELVIDATSGFGSGAYRVYVTGDNASSDNSNVVTVDVSVKPDPPQFDPVTSCIPGKKTIEVNGDNDGYYRWYENTSSAPIPGAVNHDFTTPFLTSETTYYVTEINGACESDFTEAVVHIDILVDAPLGTDAFSCSSPAVLTLKAESETAGSFSWYENSEDDAPLITETTGKFTTPALTSSKTYYVSFSDGTCESIRTEVLAEVGSIAAPTASPVTICANNSVTIEATAGTNGEVRWYESASATSPLHTGTTFITPVLSASATYHVSYFETGCESTRTQVTVTVNNCTNNLPPVIAEASGSTLVGNTVIIPLNISDPDNNLDLSTLKIITQPAHGVASINQQGQLEVDYSGSTFVGNDELVVEVCDLVGSCFQRTITIKIDGDVNIYNAMSPNNDGKNDVFFIDHVTTIASTKNNRVRIFNRWGDLVYDVDNYDNVNNVFAGKSNSGKDLPSGTYYYMIDFSDRKAETGYLVLKR
ncbi:MAG: gliding motility-associated C-terminal domain-containing protein [Bacteroidota bacterium]